MNLSDLGIASSAINSRVAVKVTIDSPGSGETEIIATLPKHAAPSQAAVDQAVRDALASDEGSSLVSANLTAL